MDDHKLYAKEEERWLDVALFATNLLSNAAGCRWSRQILRSFRPASSAGVGALRLSRLSELGYFCGAS